MDLMNNLAFGGDATADLNEQMSQHLEKMKRLRSPFKKKKTMLSKKRKKELIKQQKLLTSNSLTAKERQEIMRTFGELMDESEQLSPELSSPFPADPSEYEMTEQNLDQHTSIEKKRESIKQQHKKLYLEQSKSIDANFLSIHDEADDKIYYYVEKLMGVSTKF